MDCLAAPAVASSPLYCRLHLYRSSTSTRVESVRYKTLVFSPCRQPASATPLSVSQGGDVSSCCWNSLGKVLASVGDYDSIRLTMWNGALIDKVATRTVEGSTAPRAVANCLSFSRGNKYCAIGYEDGALPIWDLKRQVREAVSRWASRTKNCSELVRRMKTHSV
jgi:WD40 repeat protein